MLLISHDLRYAPHKSEYLAFKCLLVPPHVPATSAAHLSIQESLHPRLSCRGERKLRFNMYTSNHIADFMDVDIVILVKSDVEI